MINIEYKCIEKNSTFVGILSQHNIQLQIYVSQIFRQKHKI